MTSKIVVRLKGGLGNQLFQYAFGVSLSRKTGFDLVLDDYTGFERDTEYRRSFALGFFAHSGRLANRAERLQPLERTRRGMRKSLERVLGAGAAGYLSQNGFVGYWPEAATLVPRRTTIIDGYWQSPKYFHSTQDLLASQLRSPLNANELTCDSIVVHIRDFGTSSPAHSQARAPIHYFVNAVEQVRQRVGRATRVVAMSDHLDGAYFNSIASALMRQGPFHVMNVDSAHEVLWTLSTSRGCVLSRSTLSWWGGWLASRSGAVVAAPLSATAVGVAAWDPRELVLDGWVGVE